MRPTSATALTALLACASLAVTASAITAPSNLTAQHPPRFQNYVRLNWQNNANPGSDYRIGVYRSVNSTADADYFRVAQLSITATTYSDMTILRSYTYRYKVRVEYQPQFVAPTFPTRPGTTSSYSGAVAALLYQSGWSNVVSVMYPLLAAPTNLELTEITATSMRVQWRDNSPDEGGFVIERRAPDGTTAAMTVDSDVTSYVWTGLQADTSYSFRVRAFDLYGSASTWTGWASRLTQPLAPSLLIAQSSTDSSVTLGWTLLSTNSGTDAELTRLVDGRQETIPVAQPNLNQLTVTNLLPGTNYRFRVRARNASGVTAWSNPVTILTTGQPPPTRIRLQNQTSYPLISIQVNGQEQIAWGSGLAVGETGYVDRPPGTYSLVVTNGPGSLMPFYRMPLGSVTLNYADNVLVTVQNPSVVQIMMNMNIGVPRDWQGLSDSGSILLYRFFTNGYQLIRSLDSAILEQGTYAFVSQPIPGTGVLRVRITPNGGVARIVRLDELTRTFLFESGINRGPYQMIP